MNREEFTAIVQQIGTTEDEAERRELLAQLSESAGAVFDENTTLTATAEDYRQQNEALRAANMKLFTRLGSDDSGKPEVSDPDPEPERRKFENLFDEKGRLK